ncbi:hypothetical protein NEILACOT_04192 [Neisseria lactamica ATCC 23970]|uniref:Uncharacterized protein n=1 Tax=Neisseria lactamica ATCC 23970 TaxID=546265 RepID=D0W9I0_NEILA|nr:hypothetical protein NEILACOT_04192 [Neisseria lactamica ATCC 23970]
MTAVGVSVFSDGFLWFFGYWIPAFAGMTRWGFVWLLADWWAEAHPTAQPTGFPFSRE